MVPIYLPSQSGSEGVGLITESRQEGFLTLTGASSFPLEKDFLRQGVIAYAEILLIPVREEIHPEGVRNVAVAGIAHKADPHAFAFVTVPIDSGSEILFVYVDCHGKYLLDP
jgi:hypothetical protein